jgi:DNA-nicking Smr family endonuclease
MVKTREPNNVRRKRLLSVEEKALWQAVAKTAKPLARLRKARIRTAEIADDAAPAATPPPAIQTINVVLPDAKPARKHALPLASLTRREKSRIAKGHREIEGRIDLHGMTQARAHRALIAFLHRSVDDGASVVLVITGKGRTVGPDSERGVLRRQVPLWLGLPELRPLVLGFEAAHIGHGGEGALYVRLRRTR